MYCAWVQNTTIPSRGVKVLQWLLNIKMVYLADLVPESENAGDWENSTTSNMKECLSCSCTIPLTSATSVCQRNCAGTRMDNWCELVILFTYIFIYIPRTPTYNHFPVMPPAVDEHIASYSIAPLAGEPLRCVTLLGGCFITFHCQVVVRHFQFSMSRFGVQFKWLT